MAVHRFVTLQSTHGEQTLKSLFRLHLRHDIAPSYLDRELGQRLIADRAPKGVCAGSPLHPVICCRIVSAATHRPVKIDQTPEQNGTARCPDARR
jgi:hypothetical protein